MTEIVFVVEEDPEEGYNARALETLREMIRDAVRCHFSEEENCPQIIPLQGGDRETRFFEKTGFLGDD